MPDMQILLCRLFIHLIVVLNVTTNQTIFLLSDCYLLSTPPPYVCVPNACANTALRRTPDCDCDGGDDDDKDE